MTSDSVKEVKEPITRSESPQHGWSMAAADAYWPGAPRAGVAAPSVEEKGLRPDVGFCNPALPPIEVGPDYKGPHLAPPNFDFNKPNQPYDNPNHPLGPITDPCPLSPPVS